MTIGHAHSNHLKHDPTRGFGVFESYLAKKRASIAESKIPIDARKGRVLDIGCGAFPFFLVNTNFNEKYGVDSIVHKKDFGKSIVLKSLDIEKEKLPFKNNYFDTVVMLAVFEHVRDEKLNTLLKEVRRVLKNEGLFIMTTPASWSVSVLWALSRIGLVSKIEIDDHKNFNPPSKIRKILEDAGFEPHKIKSGYFEFYLNTYFVAKK
ncbi:MAG: hypothetical protein COX79_04825 [Candidatus Levybacteria bacterium CG_4_10_14_0_2_um_filter_36_16]|nr:MAG: hypothetical protein AUK12_00540 [Candidatus Levybacteria bacterium CG2_30_37_29]PIZ96566.1 MAG: hypothetical protein COX79_04825 [Candidatus Levybacteria bacterium CG_4_10_14_0_2_um_filter_36_16]